MRRRVCLFVVVMAGCAPAPRAPGSEPPGPAERFAAPQMRVLDEPGTWRRSPLPANTSRLMVGDTRQLPLEQMDMRVQVDGFRARVLIDFVFVNPDDQVYEGTFQMRLPDEASPYFLAFGQGQIEAAPPVTLAADLSDMFTPQAIMAARAGEWISPKEALVVPRTLASAAYSETVHPRLVRVVVDPALSEWAGAGVFNTRLFPIAGKRRHRVVFGYDVDLAPSGPDLALELPLPDGPALRVDVEAPVTARVSPQVAASAIGATSTEHTRASWRFEQPRGSISVRVADRPVLMQGQDSAAGPLFAARVTPAIPEAPPATTRSQAIFAVDTSLSANPARFNIWLALLREILAANRSELREFAVVFFNVEALWWQPRFVANTPENVAALLGFANTLALEGATDLGAALGQAGSPPWAARGQWDVFLLSDGAATWGEDDARTVARRFAGEDCKDGGCPAGLYTYRTHGAGVDPRLLGILARETGGAAISVDGEAAATRVATAHRRRQWQLTGVQVDGGEDVLVAGRPQTVVAGQPLVVVGRGAPAAGAKVRLALRLGAESRTVAVDAGAALTSTLAPRMFGQVAVDQLEEVIDSSLGVRTEAEAYAQHFRVVGKACSLLMLEGEEDYRKFGVAGGVDPSRVRTSVEGTVAAAVQRQASEGADPRAVLVRALGELGATKGVALAIDGRVGPLIAAAPPEMVAVPSLPLVTRSSAWREIPAVLRPQLARQDVEEAALLGEALARRERLGAGDAMKAMSSLAELRPGDDGVLRGLGLMALAWELPGAAYHLLRRASELPPYDPITHHLMAVALAQLGRPELAIVHFEISLASGWEARFGGYREAVLQDYERFLATAESVRHAPTAEFMRARGGELRGNVGSSPLVVTLHWSGDNADVDLHVIGPDGADVNYANRSGSYGTLGVDATDGFGPELYRGGGAPGTYTIAAKLFSGARHRASTRMQVMLTVYKGDGTVTRHAATLEPGKVAVPITTVVMP